MNVFVKPVPENKGPGLILVDTPHRTISGFFQGSNHALTEQASSSQGVYYDSPRIHQDSSTNVQSLGSRFDWRRKRLEQPPPSSCYVLVSTASVANKSSGPTPLALPGFPSPQNPYVVIADHSSPIIMHVQDSNIRVLLLPWCACAYQCQQREPCPKMTKED